MSVIAVIQARVGSTRLPRKMLAEIAGVPMVVHTIRRAKAADLVNRTILAIPDTAENDVLAALAESEGCEVFRGSEENVLSRTYCAALFTHPDVDVIVRLCGEDCYTDPKLIDLAITGFLSAWAEPDPQVGGPQYLELGGIYWAEGMQVPVFTRAALEAAHKNATGSEREHVCDWMKANYYTWYLKDEQQRATIGTKLSVDTIQDYSLAVKIYDRCYESDRLFGYDSTLRALKELEVSV